MAPDDFTGPYRSGGTTPGRRAYYGGPVPPLRALVPRPGWLSPTGPSHRVCVAAPPSAVWALLGHPLRWPGFDPFVAAVQGVAGQARTGQHLLVIGRPLSLRIPVDVDYADPECRLEITVRTLPGLAQEIEHVIVPRTNGGSEIVVRVRTTGPLARVGVLPGQAAAVLRLRRLARRAEAEYRGRGRHAA